MQYQEYTYQWYNDQYDENLLKASDYQILALSVNEDINDELSKIYGINDLKIKLPGLKRALSESEAANENITIYLNNAKQHAKNDIEKEYINLLLEKNELNNYVNKEKRERFLVMEKETDGNKSFFESLKQSNQIVDKYVPYGSDIEDVNNRIIKLLTEKPDFKKHLMNIGIDKIYLGGNPRESSK